MVNWSPQFHLQKCKSRRGLQTSWAGLYSLGSWHSWQLAQSSQRAGDQAGCGPSKADWWDGGCDHQAAPPTPLPSSHEGQLCATYWASARGATPWWWTWYDLEWNVVRVPSLHQNISHLWISFASFLHPDWIARVFNMFPTINWSRKARRKVRNIFSWKYFVLRKWKPRLSFWHTWHPTLNWHCKARRKCPNIFSWKYCFQMKWTPDHSSDTSIFTKVPKSLNPQSIEQMLNSSRRP